MQLQPRSLGELRWTSLSSLWLYGSEQVRWFCRADVAEKRDKEGLTRKMYSFIYALTPALPPRSDAVRMSGLVNTTMCSACGTVQSKGTQCHVLPHHNCPVSPAHIHPKPHQGQSLFWGYQSSYSTVLWQGTAWPEKQISWWRDDSGSAGMSFPFINMARTNGLEIKTLFFPQMWNNHWGWLKNHLDMLCTCTTLHNKI